MFEHILVPVDLTDKNLPALRTAFELSSHAGGAVTLLHVIERIQDAPPEEVQDFYSELEAAAAKKTEALLEQLAPDVMTPERLERRIVYGRRAQQIIGYAEEQQVDLIVLSSRRLDPENPTEGWGTISQKAALLAPCAVLLVR